MSDFTINAGRALLSDLVFVTRETASEKHCVQASGSLIGANIERFACGLVSPFLNGVIHISSDQSDVDQDLVSEQIKFFTEAKTPHIWWLTSLDQKEKVGPLLEKNGYLSGGTYQGFAASADKVDLTQLPKLPKEANIKMHEVSSAEDLTLFCKTFAKIFGLTEDIENQYLKMLADFGKNRVYRHIYATVDEKVVGVMSAMFRDGWCGAWNGGVLVEARGKGVGRALGNALVRLGVEEGVQGYSGLLMADASAKPLAVKLGGQKVTEIFPYIYGSTSEEIEPQ